jgi:glycosyltransferase involved in cell wall biosynthesis
MKISNDIKVAIIHEWFTKIAGSEKVVEQILYLFPQAEIYVVYADPLTLKNTKFLQGRKIISSFISSLPMANKLYRNYLPLMPLAIEQFDLSSYDIVISSAHAVSKGVLTGPDQLHISYVHSPIRYAWDLQHQYLRESGIERGLKSWLTRWLLHKIRIWDYRTSSGVDYFIANSLFIGRRIQKVYGRSSRVIYPPVDIHSFQLYVQKQDFYLSASRLVPYKRMDIIIEAFNKMPNKKLFVVGDGPEFHRLSKLAASNVTLLGYLEFNELKHYMQRAKAFVFAAEEDFGIVAVEAQACGTPVIAYGKGGSLETVIDTDDPLRRTGILFSEQTSQSVEEAINTFEGLLTPISSEVCRQHAESFSVERFRIDFSQYVFEKWEEFRRFNRRV